MAIQTVNTLASDICGIDLAMKGAIPSEKAHLALLVSNHKVLRPLLRGNLGAECCEGLHPSAAIPPNSHWPKVG